MTAPLSDNLMAALRSAPEAYKDPTLALTAAVTPGDTQQNTEVAAHLLNAQAQGNAVNTVATHHGGHGLFGATLSWLGGGVQGAMDLAGKGLQEGMHLANVPLQEIQHQYRYLRDVESQHGFGAMLLQSLPMVVGGTLGALATGGSGGFAGAALGAELFGGIGDRTLGYDDSWKRTGSATYVDPHGGQPISPGRDMARGLDALTSKFGLHIEQHKGFDLYDAVSAAGDGLFDLSLDPLAKVGALHKAAVGEAGLKGALATRWGGTAMKDADIVKVASQNKSVDRALKLMAKIDDPGEIAARFPKFKAFAPQLAKAGTWEEAGQVFVDNATAAEMTGKLLPRRAIGKTLFGPGVQALREWSQSASLGQGATKALGEGRVAGAAKGLERYAGETYKRVTTFVPTSFDEVTQKLSRTTLYFNDPGSTGTILNMARWGHTEGAARALATDWALGTVPQRMATFRNVLTQNLANRMEAVEAGWTQSEAGVDAIKNLGDKIDGLLGGVDAGHTTPWAFDEEGRIISKYTSKGQTVSQPVLENQHFSVPMPDYIKFDRHLKALGNGNALYGKIDDFLYSHFTQNVFKKWVLASLGFAFRVATGEILPQIYRSGGEIWGAKIATSMAKRGWTLEPGEGDHVGAVVTRFLANHTTKLTDDEIGALASNIKGLDGHTVTPAVSAGHGQGQEIIGTEEYVKDELYYQKMQVPKSVRITDEVQAWGPDHDDHWIFHQAQAKNMAEGSPAARAAAEAYAEVMHPPQMVPRTVEELRQAVEDAQTEAWAARTDPERLFHGSPHELQVGRGPTNTGEYLTASLGLNLVDDPLEAHKYATLRSERGKAPKMYSAARPSGPTHRTYESIDALGAEFKQFVEERGGQVTPEQYEMKADPKFYQDFQKHLLDQGVESISFPYAEEMAIKGAKSAEHVIILKATPETAKLLPEQEVSALVGRARTSRAALETAQEDLIKGQAAEAAGKLENQVSPEARTRAAGAKRAAIETLESSPGFDLFADGAEAALKAEGERAFQASLVESAQAEGIPLPQKTQRVTLSPAEMDVRKPRATHAANLAAKKVLDETPEEILNQHVRHFEATNVDERMPGRVGTDVRRWVKGTKEVPGHYEMTGETRTISRDEPIQGDLFPTSEHPETQWVPGVEGANGEWVETGNTAVAGQWTEQRNLVNPQGNTPGGMRTGTQYGGLGDPNVAEAASPATTTYKEKKWVPGTRGKEGHYEYTGRTRTVSHETGQQSLLPGTDVPEQRWVPGTPGVAASTEQVAGHLAGPQLLEQPRLGLEEMPHDPHEDWARVITETMKGTVHGADGTLHSEILNAIAEGRAPDTEYMRNMPMEQRPAKIMGAYEKPPAPHRLSDRIFNQLNGIVNWMSREPIYNAEFLRQYRDFKPMIDAGILTPDEAHIRMNTRAANNVLPHIHNIHERSLMSEHMRNFVPFYFAQQQSYARLFRLLAEDPQAFRKIQLTYSNLADFGGLYDDGSGNHQFVVPGMGWLNSGSMKGLAALGIPVINSLPTAFTGNLKSLASLSPFLEGSEVIRPGPLVSLGIRGITNLLPEIGGLKEGFRAATDPIIGTQGQSQSMMDMLIPNAAVRNAYHAFAGVDNRTQMKSVLDAVQSLEYQQNVAVTKWKEGGQKGEMPQLVPTATATDMQRQAFIDRVKNTARIFSMTKAIVGTLSPVAPGIAIGDYGLKTELYDAIKTDGISKAITDFVHKHPDATPYAVFETDSGTSSPIEATHPAQAWVTGNLDFINSSKYSAAASYFVPQSDGKFDQTIYNEQMAMGLRHTKAPEQLIKDIHIYEGNRWYFDIYRPARDAEMKKAASPHQKEVVRKQWQTAGGKGANGEQIDSFESRKLVNPIWYTNFSSGGRDAERGVALQQMQQAIASGDAPASPMTKGLTALLGDYQRHAEAMLPGRSDSYASAQRNQEKANWQAHLKTVGDKEPQLAMVINNIFRGV